MSTIFWNRNIPGEAHDKMIELSSVGHDLMWLAFPPPGGNRWSLITNKTFFNRNIPDECHDQMKELRNAGHKLRQVAFPPQGGNRWSIISATSFFNRNVPTECHMMLGEINTCHGPVRCLAFDPDKNGWTVLSAAKSALVYRLPFDSDSAWALSNGNWDDPTRVTGEIRTACRRSLSTSPTPRAVRSGRREVAPSTRSSNRNRGTAGEARTPATLAWGTTWSSRTATAPSACTGT